MDPEWLFSPDANTNNKRRMWDDRKAKVCLAGCSEIPAPTVPLRGNSVARSRHKMLVRGDITLNGGLAAGIAVFFQPA